MYTLFCNTVMKSSVTANTRSGADACFHMILPHQGENKFMFPVLFLGFLQFLCVSVAPVTLGQISSDSSLMNKREYLQKYKYTVAQIKSPSFLHPGSNLPEQLLTHQIAPLWFKNADLGTNNCFSEMINVEYF